METILDKVIEQNEFPIVFIGSGISKRFLLEFPDWTSLLEEYWLNIGGVNFYGYFNNIRDEIKQSNSTYTEKEIDHYANINVATEIEQRFNILFNNEEITIPGFSTKEAFQTRISPFKKSISNRFSKYHMREESIDEYEYFKKMLSKAQIVLTTNYDNFIEDAHNSFSEYSIMKYIGQKGFFRDTYGYSELFKIHGCVEEPSSIVITEEDYDEFHNNSVLISAKIISMMLHSPIIFLGYSMTDLNIRNIIKDFTSSLTAEEINLLESRLVFVEYLENEGELIEEIINDRDLGCKVTVIKTDNYKRVFEKISSVNQGIAPSQIRKYHQILKRLIIDRGKEGSLNSVLLAPEELDILEDNLQNKKIAVAMGDTSIIFSMPDLVSYCLDYIEENNDINTEIQLRFIVNQQSKARLPMVKLLDSSLIDNSSLHDSEKEKLYNKVPYMTTFENHYSKINKSNIITLDEVTIEKLDELEERREKIYATISYNINQLELEKVKEFLVKELRKLKDKGEIKMSTELRRLLLIYDIRKNKRANA